MEVVGSDSTRTTTADQRRLRLIHHHDITCSPDGHLLPDTSNRTGIIWSNLQTSGITQRCVVLDAEEAGDKRILSAHTRNHVNVINNISSKQSNSQKKQIASKFSYVYLNEVSPEAAYLASGSVTEDEPCDICGDVGFSGSMSTCFNCRMAREHIYCMRVLLKEVPKIWFCESCRSSIGIISPKLAGEELLPVALAADSSNIIKSGTLQTVGPSKAYKDPRQSAHLVNDLFPVSLPSNSTRIVKNGILQHVGPSKLHKDPGEPVHLMKQTAVETAKLKLKPFEESDQLSLGSKQLERSLQSNRGLIPYQSGSTTSIKKKTVVFKTSPTKFSLMKVEDNPSFLTGHVKTPGHGNAITQQAPQTSTEFKGEVPMLKMKTWDKYHIH